MKNKILPTEVDLEVPKESTFLLAVSGMCVKSALKKLYSYDKQEEEKERNILGKLKCHRAQPVD